MFKQMKKGFSLVEILVAMIILGILGVLTIPNYSSTTSSSKIEVIASIFKNYHLAITLNSSHKDYSILMEKVNAISDNDEDMLDELQELHIINQKFPKEMFEEPEKLIVEIRTIKIDGYKRIIYLFADSTNERDKYILDEAIKKLNLSTQIN